jgi:hypothetical protein
VRRLGDPLHLGVVTGEGVLALEELDGALTRVAELRLDGLGQLVDPGEVDVADVAQRLQVPLRAAELGEPADPAVGGRRRLGPGTPDQGRDVAAAVSEAAWSVSARTFSYSSRT